MRYGFRCRDDTRRGRRLEASKKAARGGLDVVPGSGSRFQGFPESETVSVAEVEEPGVGVRLET